MTATILPFPTVAITRDRPIEHGRLHDALVRLQAVLPASAFGVLRTVLEWTTFLAKPEEVFMLEDFREYAKLRTTQAEWAIMYLEEHGLIVVKERTQCGDYVIQPNVMVLLNITKKLHEAQGN